MRFDTNNTERLRITAANPLVGIGTNNPQTELEVKSATDPKIRLESQESGNKRLELYVDGGEAIGYIAADQSASQLQTKLLIRKSSSKCYNFGWYQHNSRNPS